jgi:CTP synthase
LAKRNIKYIFVTGGVVSSLGKGIAAASLGLLLKARGLSVAMQKFDPYINVDAGTMNPFQHGEVYVTDDGAETDLDLGHYERFLDVTTTRASNTTTGQIYYEVISKERRGDYLGACVQVVPHVTDEIARRFSAPYENGNYDVVITEIGGTVGDIEGLPFLEAMRQFMLKVGRRNALNIHVTLVPYIEAAGEIKTKPTQHSVKNLLEIGVQPEILICRTSKRITRDVKEKIAMFTNIDADSVIEGRDVETIYEMPLIFRKQHLDQIVLDKLNLRAKEPTLSDWERLVERVKSPKYNVKIGICGKYTELLDAYKSIREAFIHAGAENDAKVELKWIAAEDIEKDGTDSYLSDIDGLLVPGGFGERGIEGMILAIKYAREKRLPYFGICLGMQTAIIEFARNVVGWKDANSSEFKKTSHSVIDIMPGQKTVKEKGGTMRLGAYICMLQKGSKAYHAYGTEVISERHRHRFEVNNKFRKKIADAGMKFSGISPDGELVEMSELPDHPWFVGCQFHPELKSRATKAHPLFREFIRAALEEKMKD